MILPFQVQEELKKKSGSDLSTSSDVERLVLDIEGKTGQPFGLNTMKRLLGLLEDEREPRVSTLDIIARYLGYDNWNMLSKMGDKMYSSGFNPPDIVDRVTVGSRVRLTYKPDRELIIRNIGDHKYVVEKSVNSKLCAGDELEIWHMMRKYPLYVSDVRRDGESLGSYTACKVGGLTALRILKDGGLVV